MSTEYKAYLRVRKLGTDELIHSVGLQQINQSYVERVMRGMLINMDTDNYYIDDSEVEEAQKKEGL